LVPDYVKRLFVLGCLGLLALSVHAEEAVTPPAEYAFDQPELLADQRLWGIAHGARLLALACAHAGHGEPAEAWVDWQERELAELARLRGVLARHYFQQEDVLPGRITAMLGLKQSLDLAPEALDAACATLAETLAQPRYDLKLRREELLKKP
jgi:hypothetical protein